MGSDILQAELQKQIDQASPNQFLDRHVQDASDLAHIIQVGATLYQVKADAEK
jgi:hypothetical protein